MKILLLTVCMLTLVIIAPTIAQDALLSKQDKQVIKLIASLPEVISLKRTMLKHNGRPLIFTIDSEPTKTAPYFKIAVSEDLLNHSFMYYRFCVNAKTFVISYYDTIADKRIPLNVWRKHGRKI